MFIPHCTVIACFGFALTQSLAGCGHAETQLEPKDESHVQAKRLKGCNAQGYSEQIVEPAVVDYVELQRKVVKRSGADPERVYPAVIKIMSRVEYEKLPKMMSVPRAIRIPAVFKDEFHPNPFGSIADYDILIYPDGTETHRPLTTSIIHRQRGFIKSVSIPVLVSHPKTEWVEDRLPRPAPITLPSGDLQVIITPAYTEPVPVPHVFETVKERFVKSRKPAIIALSSCAVER